ncbi:GAF domain nucleotide-binding protein [Phakopsora pachyrhizi]|uniref:GAF domain nucleotide-binding protein n=1 Tax=Phakopsora pachyrhizi TaxID=170000 RepID=A0AAV0AZJ5_PHAPC|nr:GAF domain nucleotide-binding protein [Phakopsora pachyrhizi]CAH7674998.1 GAF domain nucleotide-binding protein [Phakopsora pachyrhizi]
MVHAEASQLPAHLLVKGVSKADKIEFYEQLAKNLHHLLYGEKNWVVNLSNASSLLFNAYQETNGGEGRGINWTGFYLLPHLFPSAPLKKPSSPQSPFAPGKLILGPFQGKPACQHIPLPTISPSSSPGKLVTNQSPSVCGLSFLDRIPVLVKDVEAFKGHIACDSKTKSELVLPLLIKRDGIKCCLGVLDVDCTLLNGFDDDDRIGLEKVLKVVIEATQWW